MKKYLRLAVCAALLVALAAKPAVATETITFDGAWWTGLTDGQQVVAVESLLAGYESGYSNGFVKAVTKDIGDYHSTRTTAQTTEDPNLVTAFSKTFGVYQQEITDFYSQHPSSTGATVGDVLSCLSDDPQFTCDEIAKWAAK